MLVHQQGCRGTRFLHHWHNGESSAIALAVAASRRVSRYSTGSPSCPAWKIPRIIL